MKNKQSIKKRERIYQILRVFDATNEASWWNIADEMLKEIDKAVEERDNQWIKQLDKLGYKVLEELKPKQ